MPPERRGAANARIGSSITLLNQLVGPPLAGALLGVGVAVASGAAGGTYAIAIVGLVLLARWSRTSGRASGDIDPGSLRTRAVAGVQALWRAPLLRHRTGLTAGMNLVWGAWTAVFALYAVKPGTLGLDPFEFGLLLTGMAAGGLVAALVVDPLSRVCGVRVLLMADRSARSPW